MRTLRILAVAGAVALAPTAARAQLVVSTGTDVVGGRDQRWQVAVNNTGSTFTSYVNAFVGTRTSNWLMASADGNFPNPSGGVGGVRYGLRTSFSLNAGDQLTLTLRCLTDNIFTSFLVNGNAFPGSSCRSIAEPTQPTFVIDPSAFRTGVNQLVVLFTGDGIGDGAEVVVVSSTLVPGTPPTGVVPEPSTYALMATGLAGLAALRRRLARAA